MIRWTVLGLLASVGALAACGDDDAAPAPASPNTTADAGTNDAGDTTADAGADGGDTTPLGGLASGEGFSIVYTASPGIGVDARPDVKATFDASGHMTAYEASDQEKLALGAATDPSAGGDEFAAWGAWTGGPTTGVFYTAKPAGDFTFEGFHYAIGKKTLATALPAGTTSYNLAGASTPTVDDSSDTGKLDALTANCDFGPKTCTFTIAASAGGATFAVTTEAGTLNVGPAGSGQIRVGDVVALFLGGAGERIGLIYFGKMTDGKTIRGAAVLKR